MDLHVYCKGRNPGIYEFKGTFEGNQMEVILASSPVAVQLGEGRHDVFATWDRGSGYAKRFIVEVPAPAPAAKVTEVTE